MSQHKHRARSVDELYEVLGKLTPSEAELSAAQPLETQPGDVFIAPYSKCGTTMLQQMFHQLRTADRGGDMEFDDISRVVPYIEEAALLGIDLNARQVAEPRGFKSHLHYEGLPQGALYLICLRDPKEAFVSLYHFFSGWLFEPGTIDLEEFLPVWLRSEEERVTYYRHLLSWWARRDERDTLLLEYRSILADKRKAIERVARFCGIDVDRAAVDMVEERTSRAFMTHHKEPFAEPMGRRMSEEKADLPPGGDAAKVRSSGAERQKLSSALEEHLDTIWREEVAPVTGHEDYAGLAAELALT